MREAVVVASSRTPLAKSHRGSFNITRPDDLAAHAVQRVLGKVPALAPTDVEEVILGCGQPHGPPDTDAELARAPPRHDERRGGTIRQLRSIACSLVVRHQDGGDINTVMDKGRVCRDGATANVLYLT